MLESLFLSISSLSPLILWKEPFSSRHRNQRRVFSNGFWRLFGMGHSVCPCTRSQKLLSSNRINSCPQAMELAALEKGVERPHRMLWCSWASFPARLVRRKWLPMVNPGPIRMLWKGALAFLSNETYRTCLRLGSSTNFWVRTVKLGGMKPHQTKLRHRTNTLQVKSTLGRSYTFGPYQPDQQSLCLNKNNREFVSGICFNKPQLNHRAITHIGITCKPYEFSEKYSALSSRHLECPERLNRHKWFLSNASLKDIAKIQLCRDDRWPNQPYVGILITYKDESQTALGQWRWDASLEIIPFDDKFQFMHYKSCHHAIIGIEFHIESAITEVTWSKARLHGEIFWWFNRVSNSILEF